MTVTDCPPPETDASDEMAAILASLVQHLPEPVKEAQRAVANRLGSRLPPCSWNASLWTDDFGSNGEGPLDAYTRAVFACEGCLSCPAFVECSALVDVLDPVSPEVTGVLAGRFVGQTSATADFVRREMGME